VAPSGSQFLVSAKYLWPFSKYICVRTPFERDVVTVGSSALVPDGFFLNPNEALIAGLQDGIVLRVRLLAYATE